MVYKPCVYIYELIYSFSVIGITLPSFQTSSIVEMQSLQQQVVSMASEMKQAYKQVEDSKAVLQQYRDRYDRFEIFETNDTLRHFAAWFCEISYSSVMYM